MTRYIYVPSFLYVCSNTFQRPCVNEVITRIDEVAKGQFGNWCIQHICEHGNPYDSRKAIDAILAKAPQYSMDQYASKVVEKLLKIGGDEFLEKWLKVVCQRIVHDNPRTHLIDSKSPHPMPLSEHHAKRMLVSSDQFGNYLVQWILVNSSPHLREIVASEVRCVFPLHCPCVVCINAFRSRHMVSLRGSKFGSRVAMLCCNPAFTIRPGAPSMPMRSHYGGHYNQYQGGWGAAGDYTCYNTGYTNNGATAGYHPAPPAGPSTNRYNSSYGGAYR
jgi:hypothetical protein